MCTVLDGKPFSGRRTFSVSTAMLGQPSPQVDLMGLHRVPHRLHRSGEGDYSSARQGWRGDGAAVPMRVRVGRARGSRCIPSQRHQCATVLLLRTCSMSKQTAPYLRWPT